MLFLLMLISSIGAYGQSQRENLHLKAEKEFFNLHFFENGRGMTISPDIAKFTSAFKDSKPNEVFFSSFTPSASDPISKIYKKVFEGRYGFNMRDGKIIGLFNVPYKGMEIGVLGCAACHGGKAAGRIYPGLGNKTIDPYQIGKDAKVIQAVWGMQPGKSDDFKKIHKVAMHFSKVVSDKGLSSLTRGLVPDSVIQTFFFKEQGVPFEGIARGQVKVPHLWGFVEKRKAGIFTAGDMGGDQAGWEFGAELFGSDSGEHLRKSLKKLEYTVQNVFGNFLPPRYPYEIYERRSRVGQALFEKNCQGCHGEHKRDREGYPIYEAPKFIPHHKIKTDSDRLKGIERLSELVRLSSVSDILKMKERDEQGYIAPKLWGIWARFPYLHNGSVPTLYHMFIDPVKRPKVFSMKEAGEEYRYDQKWGGLTLFKEHEKAKALLFAEFGNRNIYYTKREGHSSRGHYFDFMRDFSEEDRLSLVEFLKTL